MPVLVDGGTTVTASWEIARYREHRYPERPRLFGGECGECGEAEAFCVKSRCELVVHPALMRVIVPDIYVRLHVKDQPYFRQSREARWGITLEKFAQPPAQSVPALRHALAPLKRQPFIAGAQPMFADYIVFGAF